MEEEDDRDRSGLLESIAQKLHLELSPQDDAFKAVKVTKRANE
jgi:hypothetical protein